MDRRLVLVVALLLAVSACGGVSNPWEPTETEPPAAVPAASTTNPTTTSTVPDVARAETSTTTSSPASSTTSTTTTTTIAVAPPQTSQWPGFVVAGETGVFTVDADGAVEQRLPVAAEIAVDDTRGGLVYQLKSGRDSEGADRNTVIWWWAAGSDAPRDILVPSAGHELALHDVVNIDGDLTVLYTRHEGSNPEDLFDSIRLYDIAAGDVTEVERLPAFESGYGPASINDDFIAVKWYGHLAGSCAVMTHGGTSVDGFTAPEFDTCEEADCPSACELSPDGRVAYTVGKYEGENQWLWRLVLRNAVDGELLAAYEDGRFRGANLDLDADVLVLNGSPWAGDEAAVVMRLGDPARTWELPIPGQARILRSPVEVSASSNILRSDRLGPFSFGTTSARAAQSLTGWFGPPSGDDIVLGIEDPLPYGYATAGYFRIMSWEATGLAALFSDAGYYRDDGDPHLIGWLAWGAETTDLTTDAGIRVGSSATDLSAAYGSALSLPDRYVDECGEGWLWFVGENGALRGELSGDPASAGTFVSRMEAGARCSC